MRAAVIGHVEWVEFAWVDHVPAPGEIVHATALCEEPAGGGAMVAAELARLGAQVDLLTALGDDELGVRAVVGLRELGIEAHAALVREPTRRAFTFLDRAGERTITVIGGKLRPRGDDPRLPWALLEGADLAFFVAGDPTALRRARAARFLAATPRELPTLQAAGVVLDLLVGSALDPGERYAAGDLEPAPRLVVRTEGAHGGAAEPGGRYVAAPPPAVVRDAYGAGDCFAAALAFALAEGREPGAALELAAARGAAALARRGAHGLGTPFGVRPRTEA